MLYSKAITMAQAIHQAKRMHATHTFGTIPGFLPPFLPLVDQMHSLAACGRQWSRFDAVFFDFDRTISVADMYQFMQGSKDPAKLLDEDMWKLMGGDVNGGYLRAMRVAMLFTKLLAAGIQLGIISWSHRPVLIDVLRRTKLFRFFSEHLVFGREQGTRAVSKLAVLERVKAERMWSRSRVLFVDDRKETIEVVRAGAEVFWVPDPSKGMDVEDVTDMVFGHGASSNPATSQGYLQCQQRSL